MDDRERGFGGVPLGAVVSRGRASPRFRGPFLRTRAAARRPARAGGGRLPGLAGWAWLAVALVPVDPPVPAAAQTFPVPVFTYHRLDRFAPLDLPPPDDLRGADGAPGKAYWQQRADYEIRVELDPRKHRIAGSERISYTNHSPDTLRVLWLQLDQNLFRPESPEAGKVPSGARFEGAFKGGGFDLGEIAVVQNGRRAVATPAGAGAMPAEGRGGGGSAVAEGVAREAGGLPAYRVDGTVMELRLAEPLLPHGGTLELEIQFAFTVPEHGADRMGRLRVGKGTIYEIAQWYPRMFVYDDVHGWNVLPYLGQGEFYLEYGNFDVEITVPRDFVVVATGVLQNPEEVYTEEQQRRLEEARASEETVVIIGERQVGRRSSRPEGEGPLTWRFRAENVRDFAWAASRAFLLDGAGWNDVLILSAYPEEALGQFAPGWERSTQIVRHSLQQYSEKWYPYPYPVAINVAGPALGMEYPMIVFCTFLARGNGLFGVTDHEISHAWFPMLVGSDERRHAWMDEGFVTFMNVYSEEAFFGERSPGNLANPELMGRQMAADTAGPPVATMPDSIPEEELGYLAYGKPGAMLVVLRDYVLSPERFDPAFRAYIERWAEKHPQPADFFRTVHDVAGTRLDWYWRGWLYDRAFADMAVAEVRPEGDATYVVLENRGDLPLPLEVRLLYEDGTEECRRLPVQVWLLAERWTMRIEGHAVKNVQLDPRGMLPDGNAANDVWGRGVVIRRDTC